MTKINEAVFSILTYNTADGQHLVNAFSDETTADECCEVSSEGGINPYQLITPGSDIHADLVKRFKSMKVITPAMVKKATRDSYDEDMAIEDLVCQYQGELDDGDKDLMVSLELDYYDSEGEDEDWED